ncbi:carbohydrate ABC transporter permease [Actinotalea sp. K2]|uniref:carbohydrate ABC transporter permease n=1 Tax=Actinotalea sp. K2 TaxID=2939438 RepID=UPI002017159C|nr:sugar ABC transporter permease [Actinotalea sp. K2]MCL3860462.1 sugar ABC transporter permease [Actinotalea sp. K2]
MATTTVHEASTGTRPARRSPDRSGRGGYWFYLIPGAVLFLGVIVVPFFMNLYFSMTRWAGIGDPQWIGLDNYVRLLSDATFWMSFRNSIAMIVAMVVVPTLIGLLLAAVLFDFLGKRFDGRVASILRATYYLPQILPVAVAGILWGWILNPQTGALNVTLRQLGLEQLALNWLGDTSTALPTVMMVMIWVQIGYPVVIFMAALQRVDPELYEAAELDGAGWFRRFRAITIPQIKPETFVVTLTCTIAALKVFGPIFVLTRGGPENSTNVPSYFAYQNFFARSQVGYGAAIATVLTVIVIIVSIAFIRFQMASERKESR